MSTDSHQEAPIQPDGSGEESSQGLLHSTKEWIQNNRLASGLIGVLAISALALSSKALGPDSPEGTRVTTTTEIEHPDGKIERQTYETIITEEEPAVTATEATPEQTAEAIVVGDLPEQNWQHSGQIEQFIKQTILNSQPGRAETTTVYDRVLENLRGVFIDTVSVGKKEYTIKMYNPQIVELPDESGKHEYLIAFAAWHPQSNMMVYSLAGHGEGLSYTYDKTGYELWSLKDGSGNEIPHTPEIITAQPREINDSGVRLTDNTGWEARGQFDGLEPSDMPLKSYAAIYDSRDEILGDIYVTYSIQWEYDHVFKDKQTVQDFRAQESDSDN